MSRETDSCPVHPRADTTRVPPTTSADSAKAIPIRRRSLRELYRRSFREPARERLFIASVSFFVTFAVTRLITHSIRGDVGPFGDISIRGHHIHHLVWGILLLLAVGYGWLIQIGTGRGDSSHLAGRIMAVLYGMGAALTLDEFALWLNLKDVYWERQGRASIDAVTLFGALCSAGLWGGRFFRAAVRESLRVARASWRVVPRRRPGRSVPRPTHGAATAPEPTRRHDR